MPSEEENIQFLYLILTTGELSIDFKAVGDELDLNPGAVSKRWSRCKQAMKEKKNPGGSAYEFLWCAMKHSEGGGGKVPWQTIATACKTTVGAAQKRYSRMKKAFEKGVPAPGSTQPPKVKKASDTDEKPAGKKNSGGAKGKKIAQASVQVQVHENGYGGCGGEYLNEHQEGDSKIVVKSEESNGKAKGKKITGEKRQRSVGVSPSSTNPNLTAQLDAARGFTPINAPFKKKESPTANDSDYEDNKKPAKRAKVEKKPVIKNEIEVKAEVLSEAGDPDDELDAQQIIRELEEHLESDVHPDAVANFQGGTGAEDDSEEDVFHDASEYPLSMEAFDQKSQEGVVGVLGNWLEDQGYGDEDIVI